MSSTSYLHYLRILFAGLATTAAATAQPTFQLAPAEIDGRAFPFQQVEQAKCIEPESKFSRAEGLEGFDSVKLGRFLVATPSEVLSTDDQRRFYVFDTQDKALYCWTAAFRYDSTSGFPGIGRATVKIGNGAQTETGTLPIYGYAKTDLITATACDQFTVVVGDSNNCTVQINWKHPSKSGRLVACTWSSADPLISDGPPLPSSFPCARAAAATTATKPIDLLLGTPADLTLPLAIAGNQWSTATAFSVKNPEHTVNIQLRHQFRDGGPIMTTSVPVKFHVAFPLLSLIGCAVSGMLIGASLPLVVRFVGGKDLQIEDWRKQVFGILIYGMLFWLVLYFFAGKFSLADRQFQMDQAIPVAFFGLFLGFRGFSFLAEQFGQFLNKPKVDGNGVILLVGSSLLLMGTVTSAAPVTRQLLATDGGQVLSVTDQGISSLDNPSVRLISFAPSSIAGPAAVRISGKESRIWVTLQLPGGQVLLDEYLTNGRRANRPVIELNKPPFQLRVPPGGLVWDDKGQRLILATPAGELFQISTKYPAGSRIGSVPGLIRALAIDSANQRLFAADGRRARVFLLELRENSASSPLAFADDSYLADPRALVYDETTQTLYVADEHRDAVLYVAARPSARPLSSPWKVFVNDKYTFLHQFNFGDPVAIAIAGGQLWIGDGKVNRVFPVNLTTRQQSRPLSLP